MDQETELIELAGSVDSVIYKNEENGYTTPTVSSSRSSAAFPMPQLANR